MRFPGMKAAFSFLLLAITFCTSAQDTSENLSALEEQYFDLYESLTDYHYSDLDSARYFATELLKLASENEDSIWIAAAYEGFGYVHLYREEMDSALPYFEKQRNLLLRIASPEDVSVAYMNIGNVYSGMAQYDLCIQNYLRASNLLPEEEEYDVDRAYLNYNLANTLMDFEDFNNASKYLEVAREYAVSSEVEDLYPAILNLKAEILLREGAFQDALRLADSSLELSKKSNDLIEEVYALELKARGGLRMGNGKEAIRLQQESVRKAEIYGDPYLTLLAYAQMGEIYRRTDNLSQALEFSRKAYEMRNEQTSLSAKKQAAETYAKALDAAGNFELEAKVMANYVKYQDSLHHINLNESILSAQNKTIAENNALLRESASLQQTIIDRNNLIRLILLLGLVLAFALVVALGITSRKKNRANRELLANQSLLDEKTKALEQVNKQLENLNQGKDKLLSILTHDIKQPFNQTLGVLELLDVYTEGNDELHKVLKQVTQSVENDKKTVENLLIWSKSQFARISAHPTEVDCNDVAFKVMNELKASLQEKEIDLSLKISKDSRLIADPYHLEIILRNLITNAVKFSHRGGKLEISSIRKDKKLEIAIRDEGVGMSESEISRLFDQNRHFSQNGTLNEAGTGLGMMIVHDFVKENEGEISVESQPKKGSIFRLTFPAAS